MTGRKLESLGILTVGDLASLPAGSLQRLPGDGPRGAPGRAGPRPRSTAGRPRAGGEVDRARGDLPLRPLGPRRAPRPPPPDGGRVGHRPPQFGADRPDRHRQDPVLGLLHDHPEPLPALADRRLAGHRLGGRPRSWTRSSWTRGFDCSGSACPDSAKRTAGCQLSLDLDLQPSDSGRIRAGGRWRCRPGGGRPGGPAGPGPGRGRADPGLLGHRDRGGRRHPRQVRRWVGRPGLAGGGGRPAGEASGGGPVGPNGPVRAPKLMKIGPPPCNMVRGVWSRPQCPASGGSSGCGVFSSGGCARMKSAITAGHGVGWRGRVLAAL